MYLFFERTLLLQTVFHAPGCEALLRHSKSQTDMYRKRAERMLTFTELSGTCFGYSQNGTGGNAIGSVLRKTILNTIQDLMTEGDTDPVLFELLGVFQEGIGCDRVSDLITFILREDSTSCLTAILYFEKSPDIKFKFDVAITTKNKNGNYMRLIHNKNVYALGLDQYTWNEVPNSHQVKDKADEIKEEGLWQEVRDRYLEKKNMYLSRQDRNHPSFVVYVEAVNEVYNRYFNRGGGYNVQSIF